MPLPFILAGAAIVAAGYGVKKGVDAKDDFNTAAYVNKKAQKIFDKACEKLKNTRDNTQGSLEQLGKLKFSLYKESIIPFVKTFSKIKNINFDDNQLLGSVNMPATTEYELEEIRQIAIEMQDVVCGGITAIGSGGLAGLAAYGGVGVLGTASTGASIAGLSGVAATNATLAWLGGGSLAAGGFGMAGGMAVLGGIVAGPVLAVGGLMIASKAEAAKEDAHTNLSKSKLAVEEMESAIIVAEGIRQRFNEIHNVLVALNELFVPLLNNSQELVNSNIEKADKKGIVITLLRKLKLIKGSNHYQSYSEADKKGVFMTVSLAKTIKNVMQAPLLDKDGSITKESRDVLISANEVIENFS